MARGIQAADFISCKNDASAIATAPTLTIIQGLPDAIQHRRHTRAEKVVRRFLRVPAIFKPAECDTRIELQLRRLVCKFTSEHDSCRPDIQHAAACSMRRRSICARIGSATDQMKLASDWRLRIRAYVPAIRWVLFWRYRPGHTGADLLKALAY